jgi:hypothetical protein
MCPEGFPHLLRSNAYHAPCFHLLIRFSFCVILIWMHDGKDILSPYNEDDSAPSLQPTTWPTSSDPSTRLRLVAECSRTYEFHNAASKRTYF